MTVVLETGIFPISGPEVKLVLDTPARLVHATAECEHHKATAVTLQNAPSVVILSDVETEEGIGRITSDIAYGGNFYAILPAEQAGVAIRLDQANTLVDTGRRIRAALNEYVGDRVVHPENPGIRGVSHMMVTAEPTNPRRTRRTWSCTAPAAWTRSPCGTGTRTRMAQMQFRGELVLNQDFIHGSTNGILFTGRLIGPVKKAGPFDAVVPTVKGSGYIMGIQQFLLDPEDPFQKGFRLG